ncbi:MAG TPA: hypothetical protein VJS64_17415, partial [Pyrinomonadaceae bacterium]|nr:hypothetical protein [Pyrinomonadaceae bacterium]
GEACSSIETRALSAFSFWESRGTIFKRAVMHCAMRTIVFPPSESQPETQEALNGLAALP